MATYETIDDLKAGIDRVREEGRKIISHFNRLEREYSDWEERVLELENAIQQAQEDAGLTKEEIVQQINEPELSLFDD